MVRATFTHAFDWLGFGAKTAVRYGAMTDKPAPAQSKHCVAPRTTRRDTRKSAAPETVWPSARLKFNLANRALTVESGGKLAHALAPKGEELLASLPAAIQTKVRRNEFVKVSVMVQGSTLVRIEMPEVLFVAFKRHGASSSAPRVLLMVQREGATIRVRACGGMPYNAKAGG